MTIELRDIIQKQVDWHVIRYSYLKQQGLIDIKFGRAVILKSKIIRV